MITLRVKPYSDEELRKLAELLMRMSDSFDCAPKTPCKECGYRHLCYDIYSAKEHALKLVEEAYTK